METVIGLFGASKSIVKRASLIQIGAKDGGVNMGNVCQGNGRDVFGRG